MAVLSLPLSFNNSFWSQDYRRGLEVLYSKLEQGVAENEEIIAFIRARAAAEAHLATSLRNELLTGPPGAGFAADDGASLFMAFQGLKTESARQGDAHKAISKELDTLVADPFEEWALGHGDRIKQSKVALVDNYLRAYEHACADVSKLKHQYLAKTRRADEAEDDARFAPSNGVPDKYTTSPRLGPLGPPDREHRAPLALPQRTPSVSERIAQRLKEIQNKTASNLSTSTTASAEDLTAKKEDAADEEKPLLVVDKGKGKAVEEPPQPVIASPPPLSPPLPPQKIDIPRSTSPMPPPLASPILLGGLTLPPSAVSAMLTRAANEIPLRAYRVPLLGEYQDCFSGEALVTWLMANVAAFENNFDGAEEACKELTEERGLLRRIGEFGNTFEASEDAMYQFRPKAFELEDRPTRPAYETLSSPTKRNFAPLAEGLVKRSGTFVNLVQRAITANNSQEPAYVKARGDADAADNTYRLAVRKLDRQRLGLEERIEDTLKTLQRWEVDRLRAVKTVLLQYQGTLSNLPKSLEPSIERSGTLVASYQPESDLTALIERYRTGPFRPAPQVYESIAHGEEDVVFGIDLRKWAEGGWDAISHGDEKKDKDAIPPVLTALLTALEAKYGKLDDAEKRKTWIYEVPLTAVHHLRESLNGIPTAQPIPADFLDQYDAPVLAGAVKLWALELDPPLSTWEGWDEIRRIYPPVGAKTEVDVTPEQRLQDLQAALQRWPRVHLIVLDNIVRHLKSLVDATPLDEGNEVYITKLALTLGRSVCRPKFETEISVQDRHPTLLFIDLLKHYTEILPPTIAKKKRESERKVPIRKRTAPIDMRMHRSKLSVGSDIREQLAAHETLKKQTPLPPVPPLPASVKAPVPAPAPVAATAPVAAPAPPVQPVAAPSSAPARPTFKEPPPEDDDLPPRPTFKEPPPEHDITPPPMPRFASPPPEHDDEPTVAAIVDLTKSKAPAPAKPAPPASAVPSNGAAGAERSPSPHSPLSANEGDRVLAAKSSLARPSSVSVEATRAPVRGPRGARVARTGGGASVGNIVANLNKATSPSPTTTGFKTGHRPGASLSRSASPVVGEEAAGVKRLSRVTAVSRRQAAAGDAE